MVLKHYPSLILAGALFCSLFFNGVSVVFLSAAVCLLLIWTGSVFINQFQSGIVIAGTLLNVTLFMFWVWLGLSLFWTQVSYVSVLNFWWIGSLPLVFFTFIIAKDKERIWQQTSVIIAIIGLGLALYSLYQLGVMHKDPQSVFLNHNSHAAFINLITLPAMAVFLNKANKTVTKPTTLWVLAALLFILVFSVAQTQGRGAAISLIVGVIILVAVAWRHTKPKYLVSLVGIVIATFVLADLLWLGKIFERLGTLSSPASAGNDRFIIWQQAWEMVKAKPWSGIGLGVFFLAWPPYRSPLDASGGFYAHNDYLQIWIETGLPGLLLLFIVMAAVVIMFGRAMKQSTNTGKRIELTGLFCGLLAVSLHSLFTFNFYVMPILIVMGLALARFHMLAMSPDTRNIKMTPSHWLGKPAYTTLVPLVLLLPFLYFVGLGLSSFNHQRAATAAAEGRTKDAVDLFEQSIRYFPATDITMNAYASLMQQVLVKLPSEHASDKPLIYERAMELLNDAEERNPLRPEIFYIRGQLLRQNPELSGPGREKLAAKNYKHALTLNPRFYKARYAYAQLLRQQDKNQQASSLLEKGLQHYYYPSPDILPYYILTARLQWQAGKKDQAQVLGEKIDNILKNTEIKLRFKDIINKRGVTITVGGAVLELD